MRDFLKYTLASCLGMVIALIVVSLLGFLGVAGFVSYVSSGGDQPELPEEGVLEIKLSDQIPDKTNNAQMDFTDFEQGNIVGLQDIIRCIDRAAGDDMIKGLYINLNQNPLSNASSLELRNAIERFRDSTKFVFTYADYYSQSSYHIASAADSIYLNPNGALDFRGYGVLIPFFKDLLDKIGVEAQVFYAGDFKSATEPIRLDSMSEENRLQTKAYLRDLYDEFLADISESREISPAELESLADEFKIRQAQDALQYGLVDVIAYEDEFIDMVRRRINDDVEERVNIISLNSYYSKHKRKLLTDKGDDDVAIVYMEGSIIVQGEQAGMISSDQYVEIFRKLRRNDELKAVVIRINSGGGSALASDNISREIELLKDKGIPVVVSMGDFAASGGYYISAPGDYIYAEPNTLTGSIGVFAVIPNFNKLYNEYLGIQWDSVATGPYATSINAVQDLGEEEEKYFQSSVDSIYQRFLRHVARHRGMTPEQVHDIAQGRVWSGEDALEVKLVDSLGSLEDALNKAISMADLAEYEVKEYPRTKKPWEQIIAEFSGEQDQKPKLQREMEQWLADQFPQYQLKMELSKLKGIQMRLPFYLKAKDQSHPLTSY
jgi:protease-4